MWAIVMPPFPVKSTNVNEKLLQPTSESASNFLLLLFVFGFVFFSSSFWSRSQRKKRSIRLQYPSSILTPIGFVWKHLKNFQYLCVNLVRVALSESMESHPALRLHNFVIYHTFSRSTNHLRMMEKTPRKVWWTKINK